MSNEINKCVKCGETPVLFWTETGFGTVYFLLHCKEKSAGTSREAAAAAWNAANPVAVAEQPTGEFRALVRRLKIKAGMEVEPLPVVEPSQPEAWELIKAMEGKPDA